MIFYFSATGNSKLIASYLSKSLQLSALDMNQHDITDFTSDNVVGLIFPVHAWGMPSVIKKYLPKIIPSLKRASYIFVILCCGDDVGYCDIHVRKLLRKHSIEISAIFSLNMPNTYIGIPGFDIDTSDIQNDKLLQAHDRLNEITAIIEQRKNTTNVIRGSFAFLKSGLIRWLFNKFMINDAFFRVDSKLCTKCKQCAKVCPQNNITFTPYPKWNHNCLTCFACFHACPHKAIKFKLSGGEKGQYKAPDSL